jgi:hypothetical protein
LIYFVLLKVTGDNLRVIYCFVTGLLPALTHRGLAAVDRGSTPAQG